MKKSNWLKSLNLADDKFITEANPNVKFSRISRKQKIVAIVAIAACFVFLFGNIVMCNLWLFMPFNNTPPDVKKYADSEYYDVIQKINLLTWDKPEYKNNFEVIKCGMSNVFDSIFRYGITPKFTANNDTVLEEGIDFEPNIYSEKGSYKEVTDNQVNGIIEADRIKRSDKYIFYLDNNILRIFSIEGLDSKEVGSKCINNINDIFTDVDTFGDKSEFYLSNDCKTVTVITQCYIKDKSRYVGVLSLDVSDPANITEKGSIYITGNYMTSRMANGKLLLLTGFVFNKKDINFDDERTFLPQIITEDGSQSIPASSIISPDEINNTRYTIAMKFDANTLNLDGTAAYLSYSEDVYVSKDNIFLTHVFSDIQKRDNGDTVSNTMTEISCLTYTDTEFINKDSVIVRGYVKDQWSMDEYEGILRVVTTTNETAIRESSINRSKDVELFVDGMLTATGKSNASLYCVDLNSFEVVAKVEDFAPPYEEVQSVRFDNTTAYVCTSIELSDPVFFFDLTDINNITYKDTGTIEGFSTSLVNFENGKLLGIGQGDWNTLKVEIYTETQNGIEIFCKYELPNSDYSTFYKSYYIDRENQLIGLGVYSYDKVNYYDEANYDNPQRYVVLFFDGYDLVELVNEPLYGDNTLKRGVFIDNYMYMLGESDFKVVKLFS